MTPHKFSGWSFATLF